MPNQVNEIVNNAEEIPSSVPNSSAMPPSKENPLSPKTPTAVKSTSQVGWHTHLIFSM